MSDDPSAKPTHRHSWLQPRFSLRLLLLAVTGFAIGFPIWYRWPYQEVAQESPANAPRVVRQITTWQRQWGGGRRKHGLELWEVNGEVVASTTFKNGLRHGPYDSENVQGQYVDDLKEGTWTGPDRTSTWHRGKLHGPYEIRLRDPSAQFRKRKSAADRFANPAWAVTESLHVFKLEFTSGRLTQFNGQPASNRLFDLLEGDAIDRVTQAELTKPTTLDVIEMPIKDVALFLSELHGIYVVCDPYLSPADTPVTGECRGIDLCSALTLMTAPYGLGCDYRYGCLWITTAADTNDWQDPTGVADITPPAQSHLARVWNEPVAIESIEKPLAQALQDLENRLGTRIDSSRIQTTDNEFPVTIKLRGLPLRHTLGWLLYRSKCCCKLEDDTLVILPPDIH